MGYRFIKGKREVRIQFDQYQETIPKVLYHYTNQTGIIGILENREIWATNALYLNDSKEIAFAYQLMKEALGERKLKKKGIALIRDSLNCLLLHLDNAMLATKIHACCFSRKFDDLNQWRSYAGNENGYMIGLNTDRLIDRLHRFKNFKIVECIYDRNKQDELISQFIEAFESSLEGFFPSFGPNDVNEGLADRVASYWALKFASTIAPSFKHPAFSEEEEWRIVCVLSDRKELVLKFRSGRSAITPYLALPLQAWKTFDVGDSTPENNFTEELLSTLMIRPHFDAPFVKDGLQAFAESVGLARELVSVSTMPYRSY